MVKNCTFADCQRLRSVRFAPGTLEIGSEGHAEDIDWGAFEASGVRRVTMPSSLRALGWHAFAYCDELSRVELPEGLRIIGRGTFLQSRLGEVKIPASVWKICPEAFLDCWYLEKVEFAPRSRLETLGERAFEMTKITEFMAPQSLREIGDGAFANCYEL